MNVEPLEAKQWRWKRRCPKMVLSSESCERRKAHGWETLIPPCLSQKANHKFLCSACAGIVCFSFIWIYALKHKEKPSFALYQNLLSRLFFFCNKMQARLGSRSKVPLGQGLSPTERYRSPEFYQDHSIAVNSVTITNRSNIYSGRPELHYIQSKISPIAVGSTNLQW